ncbi:MAG: adenylyltransferase/cytidyltransferase family protein [bacterium]|nr:adenylyltransferase/cytidyltransferase family protein [bacterium]
MKYSRGIVFGVFDGLHEGHRHFLSSAAGKCKTLVVAVAPDTTARALKGRAPKHPLKDRMATVSSFDQHLIVTAGDEISGVWDVLEKEKPDIAILGYDQEEIARELDSRAIPYIYLPAHQPERFKSTLMQAKPQHNDRS